jgi:putative DNA primase/helicase
MLPNATENCNQNHFDKIPQELKRWARWVCHTPSKVPVNPKTGGNAKVNDHNTWGEFAQAVNHWESHKGNGIAGIGYVFGNFDPHCGIDLDKCRNPETWEIEAWAREIITRMNSYTEVSPSGTGVHILVKANLSQGNRKGNGVEMYDSNHYFTVTGNHLPGTPTTIENRQEELEALHREIFEADTPCPDQMSGIREGEEISKPIPSPTLDLSDRELFAKACQAANGEKFDRLWEGSWEGSYPSQSEADLALSGLLAFYTGKDAARMEKLFRQSGLMREKWERADYRERTINKAIANTIKVYSPMDAEYPSQIEDLVGDKHLPQMQGGDSAVRNVSEQQKEGTPSSLIPVWPQWVMSGAAGRFAETYGRYLETPQSFLFMAYLTCLGHVISGKVALDSEVAAQPRLFTVFLGESAGARKSTSIDKSIDFFEEAIDPNLLNTIHGVGSAEGLAKRLKKNNRALLVSDELKSLIQKMRIDASVLLPCINTLFESKRFHSVTKAKEVTIDDAELCLLAASTLDTYSNMFTSTFTDIGFLNRLFLVIGDNEKRFPIPHKVPQEEKDLLTSDLKGTLSLVWGLAMENRYSMPFAPGAREVFEAWYFNTPDSVFTKRLDAYGHRLMPLLAINEGLDVITPEIAEKAVALLNYQLAARRFADPIDADSTIAKVEERIRRLLALGPMEKRSLERKGNKSRAGIWAWDTAIKNLQNAEEVAFDRKNKVYRRTPCTWVMRGPRRMLVRKPMSYSLPHKKVRRRG